MKIRTILLVVLALVCGGSAAVGVSQLTHGGSSAKKPGTVAVLVAGTDVPRGTMVSESVLNVQHWPEHMIPEGTVSTIEEATDRAVLVPLVRGELIMNAKLASKGAGRGLAAMIPSGMRAFTIRTPHVSAGVAGFIMPGNRVDVLLTTTSRGTQDGTGGGATTTLLQNVQILAVDQTLDAPESNRIDPRDLKSVTLLVTPDQAAKLDLGMNKGILHLSLRNPEDHLEADTRPATMAELRFYQERPEPPVTQPPAGNRLLDAFAKMMAKKGDASRKTSDTPRTRYSQIHTLRGVHRGTIRIDHPQ